ncbi:hypothetical protein, partial [Salmonella enterica]|uniref:hypothetical protein n=1 Tax=Salmonella enterica TaxID=28901 RepID=UPI00398C7CF5
FPAQGGIDGFVGKDGQPKCWLEEQVGTYTSCNNMPLWDVVTGQKGPDVVLCVPHRLATAFADHSGIHAKLPGEIALNASLQYRAVAFYLGTRTGDNPQPIADRTKTVHSIS